MNTEQKLEEEIFCLKYELDTLAEVLLKRESERWVPGFLHKRTEHSHVDRYNLACRFAKGKEVIDIACGTGAGSYLLATKGQAANVDGFDIQETALRYARWRNRHPNVSFAIGDAQNLNIHDEYDFAVSFETIEHLPEPGKFITNLHGCLKRDGQLMISTPISALELDKKPVNKYHVQEWGFSTFQKLIGAFFTVEKIFVQLYPQQPRNAFGLSDNNLVVRAGRKAKRLFSTADSLQTNSSVQENFSAIEEYNGQYNEKIFGREREGYQIVLARKTK